MPDIAVQWDQRSVRAIERAIRDEIAIMEKAPAEAVKHAFIVFTQSGRAATWIGRRKRRELFPNPRYVPRRGRKPNAAKYIIQVLHQTKAPEFIPTNDKSDRRRLIARRGLAKKSWGWMLRALKPGEAFERVPGVSSRKVVQVYDRTRRSSNPFVEFWDRLIYLLKVYPTVANTAMLKAANRMQHQLDGRIKSDMLRVWHS